MSHSSTSRSAPAQFERLLQIVHEASGISISPDKRSMVAARIAPRIRKLGIEDERTYVEYLEANLSTELTPLLDLLSTNVTSFMREPSHFRVMRDRLREVTESGGKRLRIWSAACSSGEEPLSMMMEASEEFGPGLSRLDLKILATDISTRILARAKAARYPSRLLESMPADKRSRFFRRDGDDYVAREEIRDAIAYRRLNLSSFPYPMQGPFDVVFCRNVMIYFEDDLKEQMARAFRDLLAPNGVLCVGLSESLNCLDVGWERVAPSAYRKV